jgi:hypothetical protein
MILNIGYHIYIEMERKDTIIFIIKKYFSSIYFCHIVNFFSTYQIKFKIP